MRKKSKKKQIVAMTLALSVLSSSVGMCGASAAEALQAGVIRVGQDRKSVV